MKRMNKTKTILALALVALLLTCAVGGTLAYLVTQTNAVINTFTPGKVTVSVEDTVSGNVKKDVQIENTGNTTAYIRVAVVANWVKNDKVVAPWNDYNSLNVMETWDLGSDGYYYYKQPVAAGASVKLLESYTAEGGPEGAHLEMTIVAQGIQSEPASVVQNAWGVTVDDDGTISK